MTERSTLKLIVTSPQCTWHIQVIWNITAQSIGLFLGNLIGPYASMRTYGYISLSFSILFLLLFPLIPDSPYRYIVTNDFDKAEKSLQWFRRRKNVKQELQELRDYAENSSVSLLERLKELRDSSKFFINVAGFLV